MSSYKKCQLEMTEIMVKNLFPNMGMRANFGPQISKKSIFSMKQTPFD